MGSPSKQRPTPERLRQLYVEQGLTASAIAAQCSVEKITALRWLKAAGIPRRPSGNGLAARGVTGPTASELEDLIHRQHLSYREIAKRYDVDFTAVPHWLKKFGIRSPGVWETRRSGLPAREPDELELRARVERGESLRSIAEDYDVNRSTLRTRCNSFGIEVPQEGWPSDRKFVCADGHRVHSSYEQRVDNWLSERSVPHQIQPPYPWDQRYRADFLVSETYVEVWGVEHDEKYAARRAVKIARCKKEGLPLISIDHAQFTQGRHWWAPLLQLAEVG